MDAFTMTLTQATITVGLWVVPVIITAVLLCVMLRPERNPSTFGLEVLFRLLWIIPIAVVWVAYMGLELWLK